MLTVALRGSQPVAAGPGQSPGNCPVPEDLPPYGSTQLILSSLNTHFRDVYSAAPNLGSKASMPKQLSTLPHTLGPMWP